MRRPNQIHLCGWPGCRRPVPLEMWGCKTHWFTLPAELRTELNRGYSRGKLSPAWIAANDKALEWIRDIPERIKAMNVTSPPAPGTGEA